MNPKNHLSPRNKFFLMSLATLILLWVPITQIHQTHAASTGFMTITEIVALSGGEFDRNKKDFDILLNAVLAAELDGVLDDNKNDFTVFAPNDGAFIRLARDLGFGGRGEAGAFNFIVGVLRDLGGGEEGDELPVLKNVLLYHVSGGSKSAREVANAEVIYTLLEDETILPASRLSQWKSVFRFKWGAIFNHKRGPFRVKLVDNDPEFRNPTIIWRAKDIQASNGIIQTINRVLIPVDLAVPEDKSLPTITEIVAASGGEFDRNSRDYDILLNAVLAAELAEALSITPNLTAFAPNDWAFVKLAREFGYWGWDEAGAYDFIVDVLTDVGNGDPIPVLKNILLYHVSPSTKTVKDVVLSKDIRTLLTGVTFKPDGITLVDNEPALKDPKIIVRASNIKAANGRIHSINNVLIPIKVVE